MTAVREPAASGAARPAYKEIHPLCRWIAAWQRAGMTALPGRPGLPGGGLSQAARLPRRLRGPVAKSLRCYSPSTSWITPAICGARDCKNAGWSLSHLVFSGEGWGST